MIIDGSSTGTGRHDETSGPRAHIRVRKLLLVFVIIAIKVGHGNPVAIVTRPADVQRDCSRIGTATGRSQVSRVLPNPEQCRPPTWQWPRCHQPGRLPEMTATRTPIVDEIAGTANPRHRQSVPAEKRRQRSTTTTTTTTQIAVPGRRTRTPPTVSPTGRPCWSTAGTRTATTGTRTSSTGECQV